MDKIRKFYSKLDKKTQANIRAMLVKILMNDIIDLKFKKLKGFKDLFSLRIGKIRIVCKLKGNAYEVIDVDYRKNVYKNL